MVKGFHSAMLISEFAHAAGMTVDTVRFYVRQRLLRPKTGIKGGSNPYQIFDAEQVQTARAIRMMQSLGFSLKEIGGLAEEYYQGEMTQERGRKIMVGQLAMLEKKRNEIEAIITFTRARIAWMNDCQAGPEPELGASGGCDVKW